MTPVITCNDSLSTSHNRVRSANNQRWLPIAVLALVSIATLCAIGTLLAPPTYNLTEANGSKLARAQIALRLGDAASEARNYPLALRHYQACLDEAANVFSEADTFFAEVYVKRARLLYALDKTNAALIEAEAAIRILEHNGTPNNPQFVWARGLYAEILTSTGRHVEAEAQARHAIRLAILLHGENDTPAIEARGSLALVHLSAGDWVRAETLLRDVLDKLSKAM